MATQSVTQSIIESIVSPKIVGNGTGGYVAKTDIVNIDNLVVNTINGNDASNGGGSVGTNGVFNPTNPSYAKLDLHGHDLTDTTRSIHFGTNLDMNDKNITNVKYIQHSANQCGQATLVGGSAYVTTQMTLTANTVILITPIMFSYSKSSNDAFPVVSISGNLITYDGTEYTTGVGQYVIFNNSFAGLFANTYYYVNTHNSIGNGQYTITLSPYAGEDEIELKDNVVPAQTSGKPDYLSNAQPTSRFTCTVSPGRGFIIVSSSDTDNSTVNWFIAKS